MSDHKRTARLTHAKRCLRITQDGKASFYVISELNPCPSQASHAFRLIKENGEEYTVHRDIHGDHCDCADFVWRKRGHAGCKHCKGLRAVGLLPKKKGDADHETSGN